MAEEEEGRRWVIRRCTMGCRVLRSTCSKWEVRAEKTSAEGPTHHALDEIESSHANGHVGIIDAGEDGVVMSSDEMRVCRQDLDQSNESDVAHCGRLVSVSHLSFRSRPLTILIHVLEETLELVDACGGQRFSVSTIQHPSHNRSLNALVQ